MSFASAVTPMLALLLATTPAIATDCSESTDPCGTQIQWSQFESIHLQSGQVAGPPGLTADLRVSRDNGDFQIDVDIADAKQPQHGIIMVVAGRVMVSQGLALKPGAEVDALDEPLLALMLVGKLLGRALPAGPASVNSPHRVSHVDTAAGIHYATPSAEGFIPPPWSVEGLVKRGPDRSYEFDLLLKWLSADTANTRHATAMSLKGNLKHEAGFRLDDDMVLEGWRVIDLGPGAGQSKARTRLEYGARPATQPSRTIGDIRTRLASTQSNTSNASATPH
jgi:hypothetical protein